MSESRRVPWRALGLVAMVAFASRLLLLAYAAPKPQKLYAPDSFGYEQLALNLLRQGAFSTQGQPPFAPEIERTPGYPVFLAGVYAVAGHAPEAAVVVQALLGSAIAALAFALARRLGLSSRAGLIAAGALALEPVSAMTSSLLLTETVFTAALTASLVSAALWWRGEQLRWLVAAAVLLGIASLVRPVAQFLPLLLAPVIVACVARRGFASTATVLLLFLSVSMGITYSWAYRNYQVSGEWTLSTISETNLLYYRAREVLASVEGTSQEEARLSLEQQVSQRDPTLSRTAAERAYALAILRDHPLETAAMWGKGVARIFADPGFTTACTLLDRESVSVECVQGGASMNEIGVLGRALGVLAGMNALQVAILAWSSLVSALLYLASLAGVAVLAKDRRWFPLALLLVTAGYLVLLSAGAEAYSRFRIPILPVLAILGAVGADSLWQRRSIPRGAATVIK